MFKYLTLLLLESKTSGDFKKWEDEEERTFKHKHGIPRTSVQRRQAREDLGNTVRFFIDNDLARNKERDRNLRKRGTTGGIPPSTTHTRTENQKEFYQYLAKLARKARKKPSDD